jgi:DNA-binding NarL/FixJ family response regulator
MEALVDRPPKILILEDDVLVAWSLREVLTLVGWKVIGTAATVNDALCQAEITRPDLAIVDVRLPGNRDGIEGGRLLRQQFGIPVIILTGEIDRETARRAAEIEPAGYITKPVHGNQLVTAVRRAMSTAGMDLNGFSGA